MNFYEDMISSKSDENTPVEFEPGGNQNSRFADSLAKPPALNRSLDAARWQRLMDAFKLPSCIDTFSKLSRSYSERHRAYHTAPHINACLQQLDLAHPLPVRAHELELAIWFHDAIYHPSSQSNEEDSAQWCTTFLDENIIESHIVERIKNLIMATEHNTQPKSLDEFLIADIDLTVLGSDHEVFKEYDSNVRFEYRWVPSLIYRRKRKQVLQGFLDREYIFHLEHYRRYFEDQARANLRQAISSL